MKKLSFEELVKQAEAVASNELLNTIAGGVRGLSDLGSCHSEGCHTASI